MTAHFQLESEEEFQTLQIYLLLTLLIKLLTGFLIEMYLVHFVRNERNGLWQCWIDFSGSFKRLLWVFFVSVHIAQDVFVPGVDVNFSS